MASKAGNQEIARRYATAFFGLAQEQGQLDAIAKDLQALGGIIAMSEDFRALMANATLKRADQARAVLAIAQAARFADITGKFLGTIAARRRLPILPVIIREVQELVDAHRGETTADVTAAHALSPAQAEKIASALSRALNVKVNVKAHEDASILGGLVIRVGSRLIDSSVKTKLERLALALKSGGASGAQEKKIREVA